MKTPRTAIVALLAGAALTACAGPGAETAGPGPTGAAPVTSTPSPDPSVSPTDPTPPTKGGPSSAGTTTLTGTVQAGVEPNCLLLDGNLLVGGPRDVLKAGARVTVTGHAQPGMMTTCQQGTPFVVETAKPA
ncbi:hypothetical protein ONA91_13015 [Micromonospora sp. DR5-3]|uniref:hypothetical protein n=1 Tax=unclassified Micromonospora TaxID=2617518 RepID=UPI0011D62ADA|nr:MULTISPECIES: hypothetical protein [unclassified Micromonospora]MCW3815376.1 hypothetical protein [Micromonospora sp. DR5-3]TYC22831.1 hypothetical protein FXF52_18735 [Micromonospora sp. MP36]